MYMFKVFWNIVDNLNDVINEKKMSCVSKFQILSSRKIKSESNKTNV